jgi:hypothetical protein
MSIASETVGRPVHARRTGRVGRDLPWPRRLMYMAAIYTTGLTLCFLAAEIAFRLFWNPKYWIHTDRLLVGSGQTEAGKKWWPSTDYLVESSEFHTDFRTSANGYRARPGPTPATGAYRVAFVGDSFTEGMQVACESTFCGRLEKLLAPEDSSRALVCENFGVSATDLLEYWHRIHHDVLAIDPPDMIVLCIYPGNDFQGPLPDDAFDGSDKPLEDHYHKPGCVQHAIAWVNLHSKFGCYLLRGLLSIGGRRPTPADQAPRNWWADPVVAARSADVAAVRRSRSIISAIDEECRAKGIALCVLVVGPVANYKAVNSESPLGRIISGWGLEIPVIDVAIKARMIPNRQALTFPIDGHLTDSGHAEVASEAAPALAALIERGKRAGQR